MNEYVSTFGLDDAAMFLRNAPEPVLIVTHVKPDGDAFGSVVAINETLRAMGKQTRPWFVPPVPQSLLELAGGGDVAVFEEGVTDAAAIAADAKSAVVIDTGAWSQVGPLRPALEPLLEQTLIVDHHLSGDIPAKHRLIDGTAAAACEIAAQLLDALLPDDPVALAERGRRFSDEGGIKPIPPVVRDALFVGIASDTGWFRFSNTRPGTHELAARLIRQGVDHARLYGILEQGERPEKLKLLIRAVDSLTLLAGDHAAIMTIHCEDFAETGALQEETERLIDIPQQVQSIQVIVLATESKDGDAPLTRLSFRSKPGPDAINVADIAGEFGGGGHARAAGAKVAEPIDDVIPRVTAALEKACQAAGLVSGE